MTKEEFLEIFNDDDINDSKWDGDNAFQGLLIIAKYIDPMKKNIICGANHDEIYSVDIDDLIQFEISKKDVIRLKQLNWMVGDDDTYLMCFV
jgi:hypothetical protein